MHEESGVLLLPQAGYSSFGYILNTYFRNKFHVFAVAVPGACQPIVCRGRFSTRSYHLERDTVAALGFVTIKRNLQKREIETNSWTSLAQQRDAWKAVFVTLRPTAIWYDDLEQVKYTKLFCRHVHDNTPSSVTIESNASIVCMTV